MEVIILLADHVRYRSEKAVKKLFRWLNVSAILHFSSGIQKGFKNYLLFSEKQAELYIKACTIHVFTIQCVKGGGEYWVLGGKGASDR